MNISILNSKKKEISFIPVLIFVFLMVIISGYILYQIFPKKNLSFTFASPSCEKTVYILSSQETMEYLSNSVGNYDIYTDKLIQFTKRLQKEHYNIKQITEKNLLSIPQKSIVIALDTYKISKSTYKKILSFIKNGGTLIFNYHFGYFSDKNIFQGPKFIENLTGLKFISESISKDETSFYIPRVLSPLIKSDINAKREDLTLYGNDILPLFKSPFIPDFIITNWEMTSTPFLENRLLNVKESGIAWHGFLGKGKWFYFSVPSYVFLDMKETQFNKLFGNIVDFVKNDITIATFPYIDTDKAIFISEDTEYKYENMIRFSKLAKEYNINTTLFCVASLAEQYPQMTKEASSFPNIEIGSHSYSHTKIMGTSEEKVKKEILGSKEILEKITGKKIYGFRPPREEIDNIMEYWLKKSGYQYVMEKVKPFLLPKELYKGLITIPRHGTDDYIYLINLNWNKKKILNKIIQETEMLTSLNALYTLSVHTHLLSYKSNLDIIKKYFEYLKTRPDIKPLKGIELNERARLLPNISYSDTIIGNTIVLTIYNKNNKSVKNLKFRLYWPNIKIKSVISENTSVKIKKINDNFLRRYSDYKINELKPNSSTTLIIKYDEIN